MAEAISTFFDAWSEADADARHAAMAAAFAEGGTYADPMTPEPVSGADALAEYVAMFVANAPGAKAVVVDTQTRHGVTRATVAFRMADGMEQMGQYFVEQDTGGITRMVGFVGTGVPA